MYGLIVWMIKKDNGETEYKEDIRQIFVYNEKDKNFHSLQLGFSDQLHAKYWFEKFYGYSNKLQSIKDNTSNYEYENDNNYDQD